MREMFMVSVYAIPLIISVVLIRALSINRLPKITLLVLWGVVLCRLLVPITLPSPWSAYSLVNRFTVREPAAFTGRASSDIDLPAALPQAVSVSDTSGQYAAQPAIVQYTPDEPPAPLSSAGPPALILLWMAGSLLSAVFFISTHLRFRRRYSAALPVESLGVERWLSEHSMRRTVQVRQSDQINAPLTYGLLWPVILLPKNTDWQNTHQLLYILTHEWMHVRRFDVLWKWMLAAAVCLHWFNPLVWVMYVLANRDIEISCDEAVVRIFGVTAKKAYAMALISLEERRSWFSPFCFNFSKHAIEERIVSIMKYRKSSAIAIVLSVILILGTTSAFAFSATVSQSAAPNATASSEMDYAPYEPFGVTYDAGSDRLYYQGKLIRCFEDQYVFEDNIIGYTHFTEGGVIDVHTARDTSDPIRNADGSFDPSGVLTGVQPYSQEEFDARILHAQRHPDNVVTYASSGETLTPDELERQYSIYSPFGIIYDKKEDKLYYQGKLVSRLLDVMSSNGEDFSGGKFQGAMRNINQAGGEVSVEIIRDYSVLNAEGFGTITGVQATPVNKWWTADEYAAWLAQERIELQQIIGERAWNNKDGWFIWTQAKVNEAIGLYEQTLQNIRNGYLVSKDGLSGDGLLISTWNESSAMSADRVNSTTVVSPVEDLSYETDVITAYEVAVAESSSGSQFAATFQLESGAMVDLGAFDTYVERYYAVKEYCDRLVSMGQMSQQEADLVIQQFM